jgi:hypothetical protein
LAVTIPNPDGIDEGLPTSLARQSAKVVGADDHDFFAPMDSHVLRPLLFRASHHLAEPGFGLLHLPLSPVALDVTVAVVLPVRKSFPDWSC